MPVLLKLLYLRGIKEAVFVCFLEKCHTVIFRSWMLIYERVIIGPEKEILYVELWLGHFRGRGRVGGSGSQIEAKLNSVI